MSPDNKSMRRIFDDENSFSPQEIGNCVHFYVAENFVCKNRRKSCQIKIEVTKTALKTSSAEYEK